MPSDRLVLVSSTSASGILIFVICFSMIDIGFMYLNGTGIPQNDDLAYHYFKLSAEQNNIYGCYNLGTDATP